MKTRISAKWVMGLVLPLALATGSQAQDELRQSPAGRDPAPAAATAPVAPGSAPSAPAAPPGASLLPPRIHLSPWSAELVRLAQAGIEEDVMLTFVDSAGTFNLDSDQIIYLRDLGVPGEVITAMMQHDSDVVAGLRPITVSAVPAAEPAFNLPFIAGGKASAGAPASLPILPTAPPAPATSLNTAPPANPNQEYLQNVIADLRASEFTQTELFPGDESTPETQFALNRQWQAAPESAKLYPVREPYPVPLSDPIIMIRAEARPPNVIIIDPLR